MAMCALAARRTRSWVYGSRQVSSKSLMPQIKRPSESRHVPKFSTCRSPKASTPISGCQADQVVGVRQPPGLVEVVDAPDQAAFGIAPRPEILDVQIAHAQHYRRGHQAAADFRPNLRPAIVGCAHEWEQGRRHLLVLVLQIGGDDSELFGQPLFVAGGSFLDFHARPSPAPSLYQSWRQHPFQDAARGAAEALQKATA